MLVWVSLMLGAAAGFGRWIDRQAEQIIVQPAHQIQIITDKEAKVVMEYHGILSMKWSIPHRDFIFERDGKICKARAFEILKEEK